MLRGISPTAHDKFVKLPVRHPEAKATALVEATVPAPSLPEGAPQSGPATFINSNVMRESAAKFGVTPQDIMSGSRVKPVVLARRLVCQRLHKEWGLTTVAITRLLKLKDHSSVIYHLLDDEKRALKHKTKPRPTVELTCLHCKTVFSRPESKSVTARKCCSAECSAARKREANRRYKKRNPDVDRRAIAKYRAQLKARRAAVVA